MDNLEDVQRLQPSSEADYLLALEQLDSEHWDLMDKLAMNELARTAILKALRVLRAGQSPA